MQRPSGSETLVLASWTAAVMPPPWRRRRSARKRRAASRRRSTRNPRPPPSITMVRPSIRACCCRFIRVCDPIPPLDTPLRPTHLHVGVVSLTRIYLVRGPRLSRAQPREVFPRRVWPRSPSPGPGLARRAAVASQREPTSPLSGLLDSLAPLRVAPAVDSEVPPAVPQRREASALPPPPPRTHFPGLPAASPAGVSEPSPPLQPAALGSQLDLPPVDSAALPLQLVGSAWAHLRLAVGSDRPSRPQPPALSAPPLAVVAASGAASEASQLRASSGGGSLHRAGPPMVASSAASAANS